MNTILNACFEWFEAGIDLLFPPRCVVCGKQGEHWCSRCRAKVEAIEGRLCSRCGSPTPVGWKCRRCLSLQHLEALRSYAWYKGTIVPPILALKYRPNQSIASAIGASMAAVIEEAGFRLHMVAPVPLGQARFKQRGYNQAGLLAAAVAGELGLEFAPQALVRCRETASQVGLNRRGRRDNVRLAFAAIPKQVRGRAVLVVDDLVTSGATLSSCAFSLKQAGAHTVYGVTAARAYKVV